MNEDSHTVVRASDWVDSRTHRDRVMVETLLKENKRNAELITKTGRNVVKSRHEALVAMKVAKRNEESLHAIKLDVHEVKKHVSELHDVLEPLIERSSELRSGANLIESLRIIVPSVFARGALVRGTMYVLILAAGGSAIAQFLGWAG